MPVWSCGAGCTFSQLLPEPADSKLLISQIILSGFLLPACCLVRGALTPQVVGYHPVTMVIAIRSTDPKVDIYQVSGHADTQSSAPYASHSAAAAQQQHIELVERVADEPVARLQTHPLPYPRQPRR